jgi:ubiquinone biosynthesis protein UbiJ
MRDSLAEDWVALWQSELTAMAADRELRESWAAMIALWAGAAQAAIGMVRAQHDPARRTALTTQPAGAAPAAAASKPGVDEVERLNRRIAELEQRLAALERSGDGPAG